LGLRFDSAYGGPGWKVRDVLPKSPAAQKKVGLKVGDIVVKIDDVVLTAMMDPTEVLNGPLDRDMMIVFKRGDEAERTVTLRPISYSNARGLVYEQWTAMNRQRVEGLSKGSLGYLHVSAMDDSSFQEFQEQLYAAGAGRSGLVIDVRENGGGSTADHLLTALTQPQHALTLPRGGSVPGYPQDRMIYATWSKPIVVLCNQNSYSNAEIFSHAIKHLKRGQLVGVPTAGGVISTGSVSVMGLGSLRLPFRGWYGITSGTDMELNGARPDHLVWPKPGEGAQGLDTQLTKAVDVLSKEVAAWLKRPQPKLRKASESPRK
jgi:tricorn protease